MCFGKPGAEMENHFDKTIKSTMMLILFIRIATATALVCYVCSGREPFNAKDESVKVIACSGSCMMAIVDGNIDRTCHNNEKMEPSCSTAESGVIICYCNENLCNGERSTGASLHVNLATGITMMIAFLRICFQRF